MKLVFNKPIGEGDVVSSGYVYRTWFTFLLIIVQYSAGIGVHLVCYIIVNKPIVTLMSLSVSTRHCTCYLVK